VFYKGRRMVPASPDTDLHGFGDAIRKELGRHIPRGRKLKVLDVGTGFGMNASFLAGWLSEDSSIWTVDPSKEVLAKVKAEIGKVLPGRLRFVRASAEEMAFAAESFDVVSSVMVLHHMAKLGPARSLEQARVPVPP
jgi:ubiquinone/menaquinone biosynthesis C-methylase UbiE